MSVAPNTPILFSQLQALADLANAKLPASNASYTAWQHVEPLPPFFVVQNATQMIALHQADWGERPGGIAILRDGMVARRLTGTDRTDPTAWTAFTDLRVAQDATIGPYTFTTAVDGTLGVQIQGIDKGIYWAWGGYWQPLSGSLNVISYPDDLDQLRDGPNRNVLTRITNSLGFGWGSRFVAANGYYLGYTNAPAGMDGFQATRASYSGTASTMPIYGYQMREIDFYSPTEAPIVDLTGTTTIDRAYDTAAANVRMMALRVDGHPVAATGLACSLAVAATGTAPFTLTTTPALAGITASYRDLGGTVGFVDVLFTDVPLSGEVDIVVTLTGGHSFWNPIGVVGGTLTFLRRFQGASPTADDEAMGLNATYKLSVDHESLAPRWFIRSKSSPSPISGLTVPAGWPSTLWLERGQPRYIAQTPGYFLCRPWLATMERFDPEFVDTFAHYSILAPGPRSRKTWTTAGAERFARGAEYILPRVYVRRSTDDPNMVPLETFRQPGTRRIPSGCMIYDVHVRRRAVLPSGGGTPNILPAHWDAISLRLGYMRGGAFLPLAGGDLMVPENEWSVALKCEWLNMDAISLAYEADEELTIEARLARVDTYSSSLFLNYSSYGTRFAMTFEHYNALEAALNSL